MSGNTCFLEKKEDFIETCFHFDNNDIFFNIDTDIGHDWFIMSMKGGNIQEGEYLL